MKFLPGCKNRAKKNTTLTKLNLNKTRQLDYIFYTLQ